MRIVKTIAGASVALWAAAAGAQLAEPVHVRNLNPLVSIFGLPAWDTVPIGTRFGVTAEVANHYRFSLVGNERLMLDGETVRTNVAFTHGFASGWSLGVELPYYNVSGGVLDDAIDAWHAAFGMLIGGDQGFVVQATVKLPTGDEDMLAGSGSADWSLTLLRTRPLLARKRAAGYYWGVGLVRAGDPEVVEFEAETWVPTAIIGGSWQLLPEFGFKGQLDLHGAFYDSQLEEIGETAVQATFSAWRRMGQRGQIEFAVVEDLNVATAPDVVLQVAAAWQF